ncbi:cell wall-binding repeat-containing protein [Planococcus sp. YIM B11945]|uniref:cell wall-binding repeat-containing protein n=1 Tax=Planococcus sp. YIM B11945 TaxID=3435410 RepID=UPI003D7E7DB8
MPKKIFSSVMAAALTLTMVGVHETAAETTNAAGDFNLTIMHTNDTHANLDSVAKRVTLVNQIRTTNPNNLLLDAGDVFSGTLYFNEFQGQADLDFMNLMKYDAMTFGNHEFDLGANADGHKALSEFIKGAKFPFVSANVDFSKDANIASLQNDEYTAAAESGEIFNGMIKEIDGEKVGIFGLTTEETASISSPKDVAFTDYIEAAEEAVEYFEKQDVNKIIALSHLGYDDNKEIDNDQELAKAVPEIDVIVGGHTHTKITDPEKDKEGVPLTEDKAKIGNTVIVQAEQYSKFLGELDLTFNDEGVITSYARQLHEVAMAEANKEAADKLAPYAEKIAGLKNQPTGATASVALNGGRNEGGVRQSETNLGNLITDGMLAGAKKIDPETVIAVTNGGGIRAGIDEGEITVGEVLTVMPFGNSLAIMNLTGAEIKEALEISVKSYPAESGGFLHVSGLFYNFDGKAPAGERVLTAYLDNGEELTPIEDTKMYKVATNTFTAKGGDFHTSFQKAYEDGRVSEPGTIDYEMFIDHISNLKEVAPEDEGRITQVRFSGDSRYETAIAVSKEGWKSSKTVVIARGDQFADALTATPLAYKEDAPVLLTRSNKLDAGVKEELKRLGAEKAIILGGTGALSKEVADEIKDTLVGSQKIERIGGKDRYETAQKIAFRLGSSESGAIVVNGLNFPDALSASSFAAMNELPILLTRTDKIPAATEKALEDIDSTLIIGGTVAVSEAVEESLPDADRLSGANRYETSAVVAATLFEDAAVGFASNGTGFADALTGSSLAAHYEAPMLLVKQNSVSAEVDELAYDYWTTFTTGGTKAVSPKVVKELHQ